MKNATLAAVIDFGTSKITTVIAECEASTCHLLGSGVADYDGYSKNGDWNMPELLDSAIKKSIRDAEADAGEHINEVFIGVPGELTRVFIREAQADVTGSDTVSARDVDLVEQRVLDQLNLNPNSIISQSAAWYRLDDGTYTMEPIGQRSSSLTGRISVVTADMDFINDMDVRLRELDIRIVGFMPSAIGEAKMMILQSERDRAVAMVDVGYLHTEVIVMRGDAMVDYQVLPVGGGHIRADITYGLEVSYDEAEKVKRAFDFNGKGDVIIDSGRHFERDFTTEVITARVEEIADMVAEVLDNTSEQLDADLPVYLTGGGVALMEGGKDYFSKVINRPMKVPKHKLGKLSGPRFTSAVGLLDTAFDRIEADQGVTELTLGEKFRNLIARIAEKFRRKDRA